MIVKISRFEETQHLQAPSDPNFNNEVACIVGNFRHEFDMVTQMNNSPYNSGRFEIADGFRPSPDGLYYYNSKYNFYPVQGQYNLAWVYNRT